MPKVDSSKIIYPGSLTSCGFDEPSKHGMIVGNIEGKYIDYQFVKVDDTEFEKKSIDITNINSTQELIDKLNLREHVIYKIELEGTRNFDTRKVEEELRIINKNICEVTDNSKANYDLEAISKEETLKGIFTKKILEEIKYNPKEEQKLLRSVGLCLQMHEIERNKNASKKNSNQQFWKIK